MEHVKRAGDILSYGAIIASTSAWLHTIATWLPPVAALLSIIWTLLRIYETKTFQTWLIGGSNGPTSN